MDLKMSSARPALTRPEKMSCSYLTIKNSSSLSYMTFLQECPGQEVQRRFSNPHSYLYFLWVWKFKVSSFVLVLS